MDTFLVVHAVELLLAAGAALAACAALAALRLALSPARRAARLARELLGSLGAPVLVADRHGRIVEASEEAAALLADGAGLVGRELSSLGPDLPILARGVERGPASGVVSLRGRLGPVRARAAVALVSRRPRLSLVALRPEDPPRPPPLPPSPPSPRRAERVDAGAARSGLAAVADAARAPLARAARAASLLRLGAPPLDGRAAASLAALEEALEEAERRTSALAAASHAGARREVDLSALVEDVARSAALPCDVRFAGALAPARAVADDRALRAALREVLRALASSLGGGGALSIAVDAEGEGGAGVVEVVARGAVAPPDAAFARVLLAPHDARVEEERAAGEWRLRVTFPPALADALVPA